MAVIQRSLPISVLGEGLSRTPKTVNIVRDPRGRFWVDRIVIKQETPVTWQVVGPSLTPASPQPDIVVFFPEIEHAIPLTDEMRTISLSGTPGIYQYALFVRVGDSYRAVEGNSPPEMIIE
jgi:hypothetical protein